MSEPVEGMFLVGMLTLPKKSSWQPVRADWATCLKYLSRRKLAINLGIYRKPVKPLRLPAQTSHAFDLVELADGLQDRGFVVVIPGNRKKNWVNFYASKSKVRTIESSSFSSSFRVNLKPRLSCP